MQHVNYVDASRFVFRTDPKLGTLLQALWNQSDDHRKKDLCFWLAAYPFAKLLFKNGAPLAPNQQPLPDYLLLKNGLPFGLILENTVEVLDEVIQRNEVVEMPQALLSRGQLIGVFEFLDEHLNVEGRPKPNWTISAGSRSFKFLDLPTQKVQWNRLRGKYPHLSTYHKPQAHKLQEIDLLQNVMEARGPWDDWRAQVLYFSPAWFSEIGQQLSQQETFVAAMELRHYIMDLAWRSLARVRDRANELEDAIFERGGASSAAHCKAAYRLLRYSMDIVAQRRPCFAPFSSGVILGPFDGMREQILAVAKLNRHIMVPTYLYDGGVGFLSLSHLVPVAFDINPSDALEDILRILVRARFETLTTGREIPGLIDAPEFLSNVSFRVKTGRRNSDGEQASVSTFRIRLLPLHNRKGYEKEVISLQGFYEPYFSNGTYPPPDSRFFRVAIKFDLRDK